MWVVLSVRRLWGACLVPRTVSVCRFVWSGVGGNQEISTQEVNRATDAKLLGWLSTHASLHWLQNMGFTSVLVASAAPPLVSTPAPPKRRKYFTSEERRELEMALSAAVGPALCYPTSDGRLAFVVQLLRSRLGEAPPPNFIAIGAPPRGEDAKGAVAELRGSFEKALIEAGEERRLQAQKGDTSEPLIRMLANSLARQPAAQPRPKSAVAAAVTATAMANAADRAGARRLKLRLELAAAATAAALAFAAAAHAAPKPASGGGGESAATSTSAFSSSNHSSARSSSSAQSSSAYLASYSEEPQPGFRSIGVAGALCVAPPPIIITAPPPRLGSQSSPSVALSSPASAASIASGSAKGSARSSSSSLTSSFKVQPRPAA